MSGQIVPTEAKFLKIKDQLESPDMMAKIRNALPDHLSEEKMARVFLTSLSTTPKLLSCDPTSLMLAILEASSVGLFPDGGTLGHGYILPYGAKAKFIPGFRGLMDMARRSGKIEGIQARIIYEGDKFECEFGAKPKLVHVPARMLGVEQGSKIGAYASATYIGSGEVVFEVMWEADIEKIRQSSPAGTSGPWISHPEEMWRKSVLRRLMKYLPLSADMQSAVATDEYHEAGVLGKLLDEKIDPETGEVLDGKPKETLGDLIEDAEVVKQDEPSFEGKGRITDEEEEKFKTAVEKLLARAREASTEELTEDLYNKTLGSNGVTDIKEIRKRVAREAFYHEIRVEVEEWEKLS